MRYINPNSKRGLVNKFAEFILSEITKNNNHKSKIEVSLFDTFFVVNGVTECQNLIDMTDIQTKFYDKNKELFELVGIKKINTIDIIKYGVPTETITEQYFEFYNTDFPLFNEQVINIIPTIKEEYQSISYTDKIEIETSNIMVDGIFTNYSSGVISSEFPYGYSLNTNRAYLYYCEYICNQLFRVSFSNRIIFNFSKNVDEDTNDLKIHISTDSHYYDKDLKSLVLDVFDFNIENFIVTKLSNFDLNSTIDNQLVKGEWLVNDKLKEMFIT